MNEKGPAENRRERGLDGSTAWNGVQPIVNYQLSIISYQLNQRFRMSLNKVMLIGHVGTEAGVRYVDQGLAVASLRRATSEPGYTLENGTQVPERTEWHNIVLWRKQAEIVEKYVHKGDKLYIEGKIHTRSYDDKNGIRRYVVEIYAEGIELLTPKNASNT